MKASEDCFDLIKSFEGFRAHPYRCPAGIPTIGYGSTRYADGRRVSMADPPITEQHAAELLRDTLSGYEEEVSRYVAVPLTQGQYDALVDFAYNAGAQNLRTSTLLRQLNAGNYSGAADEFLKWVHGGGKTLPGLVRRREAERRMFVGSSV